MSGGGRRVQRVEAALQSAISTLLRSEIADPALQSVSVTEVRCTADLKSAKVFYGLAVAESATPGQHREIEKGLDRARPFLRRRVGEFLELRYVPALEFFLDAEPARVHRLYALLSEVSPS